ncbi:DUF4190 domain-containing protein [Mycobacterium sp. RTGN5]|uniref:DUF4190 domain-containing protein n=1 Tax=Mycobacterium sp. RTGN5 TaxID=3016522 RepID=UPI0029C8163A|nr:DUF4190 domain-containing protein [Mycobacterium sp. RTGN5]
MTNPPLPDGTTPPTDPYTPVDYPAHYPQLPPPVYPSPYPPPTGYGYPPPGYPPPGYPVDPYDPYRPIKPPGTNGKAIASLVTSVAGLLCCGLPAIAGLILGIIAMRETKRTGQDGNGLAIAGVVVGALVIVGYLAYFLIMISVGIASSPDYPT